MSGRFEFAGRRALITGAASGIGAALARDLARRGTDLLLVDVNSAGLRTLAAELAGSGVAVTTRALDLSDREAVAAFSAEVVGGGDPLHLLFNNAGVALGGTFGRVADTNFDWLMEINFHAPVRLTRMPGVHASPILAHACAVPAERRVVGSQESHRYHPACAPVGKRPVSP